MKNTTLSGISPKQVLVLKEIALAITGKSSISELMRTIASRGRVHRLNPTTGYTELLVTNSAPPSQNLYDAIERDFISTHYKPPDSPEINDKWIKAIDEQPELETQVRLFHSTLGAGMGKLYIRTPPSLDERPRLYWRFRTSSSAGILDLPFTDAIVTHWLPACLDGASPTSLAQLRSSRAGADPRTTAEIPT